MFKVPHERRIQDPHLPFEQDAFNCPDFGAFLLPPKIGSRYLLVIASSGVDSGWEHVSISVREGNKVRTPTWEEMAHIKDIFWDDEDTVAQYHPPKSQYVNNHPNVLHLWRPTGVEIALPPSIFVGFTDEQPAVAPTIKAALASWNAK